MLSAESRPASPIRAVCGIFFLTVAFLGMTFLLLQGWRQQVAAFDASISDLADSLREGH